MAGKNREKKGMKFKCAKCGEFKDYTEYKKYKVRGKSVYRYYCNDCERIRNKIRMDKNKDERNEFKRQYRRTLRGKLVMKIDNYLYYKDKQFKKTKQILQELGERDSKKRTYKKNYIIFNIPEDIISKEEKIIALNMTEDEYAKYYKANKK